jgi:DNA-binding NtrC family response regulator
MSDTHQLRGAKILIVDDIHENLSFLETALEQKDFQLSVATSGEGALRIIELAPPNLILLDVMMPGIDGFETCRRLKKMKGMKGVPVIFITAKGELPDLKEGFRSGGVDYVVKPIDTEELMVRIDTHLTNHFLTRQLAEANAGLEMKNQEMARKNEELEKEVEKRRLAEDHLEVADSQLSLANRKEAERWGIEHFVGKSRTMEVILAKIMRLHKTDTTSVLINGESGTGKELVARAVHHGSGRASKPFIVVNCAAVPGDLAESLFFGHSKGSFSGASHDQKGYFVLADGGTLFLDEVGEMPMPLQAKLLRVLEDGTFLPVGASREVKVDVRVVAATNADFQKKISEKFFREDLYYRLARYTVVVPPLRERKEDIPLLANHFLHMLAMETGRAILTLSPETLEELMAYDFPGNVRELKNVMERVMIECDGSIIQPRHLRQNNELARTVPPSSVTTSTIDADVIAAELPLNLEMAKDYLIRRALKETKGNVTNAAKLLGIHRNIIYRHKYDKGSH